MAGGIAKTVGCQLKTKMVIFSMLLQMAPTLPHQLKNFGSKFIDYISTNFLLIMCTIISNYLPSKVSL